MGSGSTPVEEEDGVAPSSRRLSCNEVPQGVQGRGRPPGGPESAQVGRSDLTLTTRCGLRG